MEPLTGSAKSMNPKQRNNRIHGVALTLLFLLVHSAGADELTCGSLENAYGPYDYTNSDHRINRIPIVESGHLSENVKALRSGVSTDLPGGDLDYTLRAVPNHHEALYAMARYEFKTGQSQPEGSSYTLDCWFERAMRFAPHDGMVHLIFGIYLHKKEDWKAAEAEYRTAIEAMPQSPEANYNLGLLYFDTEQFELSREQAIAAYRKGYPLPGLRNKLRRAGFPLVAANVE